MTDCRVTAWTLYVYNIHGLELVLRLYSGFDGRFLRPSQHAQVGGRDLALLGRDGGASIGLVDLDDLEFLPAQEPCQGS